MDIGQITADIMKDLALDLINYLKSNNITIVKNDDFNIVNMLINTQVKLNEYICGSNSLQVDNITHIRNDSNYRQNLIRNSLYTVKLGVSVNHPDFNHITLEFLDSLIIS